MKEKKKSEIINSWNEHKTIVGAEMKGHNYTYRGAIQIAKYLEPIIGLSHYKILDIIVLEGNNWADDIKTNIRRYIKYNKD
jgi:hypothetical protein